VTAVPNLDVGIFALGGAVGPPVIDAAFDWFHLTPDDTATDPGVDDEFDGDRLDGCRWDRVVREDPEAFSVRDGRLVVETTPGDIFGASNGTPSNLVLQTMPAGDWTIETTFDEELVGGFQQAGLMAYVDDDNYVKFDVIADGSGGVDRIEIRSEVGGTVQSPQPNLSPPPDDGTWWLRLTKSGNNYSGRISTDGHTWVEVGGAVPNSALATGGAFGIFTLGVNQSQPATVSFDAFRRIS
jgi:regulation of enolase protein 1 (concanavalin A-like superfamily)